MALTYTVSRWLELHLSYCEGVSDHDFEQLHHHLKMNNVVESYESFKISPRKGEVVLVKEKQDWFRGLCKDGDADNEFDIFLVDFGYSVTKKLTDIRQIKEDFLKVPFQV